MRILQVVLSSGTGGVERYVDSTTQKLRGRGHEALVLGNPAADSAGAALSAETIIDAIKIGSVTERPDLIHCHMTRAEAVGLALTLRWGVPLITTRHFARPRGSSRFARVLSRAINARADLQIAISDFVAASVEQSPDLVIWPGIEAVPAGTKPRTEQLVTIVQRLEAEKATDVGIRAWALSGLADEGWRLEIIGDGADRTHLTKLAEDLAIAGSVSFLGHVDDVRRSHLSRTSILLAPCAIEGFGLSVVEAMAQSRMVVAAASGGHLETLGPYIDLCGFPAGSPELAALRLRRAALNADERANVETGLAERYRANFTADGHLDRLLVAYEQAISHRSTAKREARE